MTKSKIFVDADYLEDLERAFLRSVENSDPFLFYGASWKGFREEMISRVLEAKEEREEPNSLQRRKR